jgi:hypothetical protein
MTINSNGDFEETFPGAFCDDTEGDTDGFCATDGFSDGIKGFSAVKGF